jgi:hypothetical protein
VSEVVVAGDAAGADQRPPSDPVAPVARRRGLRIAAGVLGWIAASVAVLALHGYFPRLGQPPAAMLVATGTIECLHRSGLAAIYHGCTAIGGPVGMPMLTGAPELYLGWLIRFLPGVDAWGAQQLSNALIDLAALVAGFFLMRRWGAPAWVALATSTLYLTSISILYLNGFGYTFTGFTLLPAFLLATLGILRLYETRRWALAVAASLALALVMVFTDGYAYFASSLVLIVFGLSWLFRAPAGWRVRVTGVGIWLVANAFAIRAYAAYVPGPTKQTTVPIGVFRYLGLDVWTLIVPQPSIWWPGWIRWDVTLPKLWGDGSNIAGNYAGLVTVGLVAWYLIRGRDGAVGTARLLAIAGAIALVLSLGPALKVDDLATSNAIDVPDSLTTLPLPPLRWLYQHAPGLDDMRATYRWFLVTRFALVFGAGLAVARLARDPRRGVRIAGAVIAVLAVAETLPDIPKDVELRRDNAQQVAAAREALIPEARQLIRPGERILALPVTNDFLATAVIPFTRGSAYNVGGDKNVALARRSWPHFVEAAAVAFRSRKTASTICDAFRSREVDAVLVPYLSMYAAAIKFPPPPEDRRKAIASAEELARDPRFVSSRGTWMAVFRPRPGSCGR